MSQIPEFLPAAEGPTAPMQCFCFRLAPPHKQPEGHCLLLSPFLTLQEYSACLEKGAQLRFVWTVFGSQGR